jgi:phage shock protein B
MHALIALILLIPLVVLAALAGLAVAILRILKGSPTWHNRTERDQETKTIQELYEGLSKMEKRIAALETILLDPERKK